MLFQIALVLALQVLYSEATCPGDSQAYAGSCYYFSHDAEEWMAAMYVCKRFVGGYLAEVSDMAENSFLTTYAQGDKLGFWLGANDVLHDGTWKWATTKSDVTFSRWNPGEPNNYKTAENCASLSSTGFWNDLPCNAPAHFVCEFPESA